MSRSPTSWSGPASTTIRGVLVVLVVVAGACSSPPSNSGTATSPPGTVVAPGTTVLVALPLQTNLAGLSSLVAALADPANPNYHHFVDLPSVADQFGASATTVSADVAVLASLGVTLTADPTRSALWGPVNAGLIAQVFGTTLTTVSNGTDQIIQPTGTPVLPAGLVGVTGAIGFTRSTQLGASAALSGTAACPAAGTASAAALSSLYGFNTLTGSDGTGTSAVVFTVGTYEPESLDQYQSCTGTALSAVNITASSVPLAPPAAGGSEAALDMLLFQIIAPAAHVNVVHIDPNASIVFPLLNLLATGSTPEAIAFTLGYCETQVPARDVALAEWLLAATAATGTSSSAAAGDAGSAPCPSSNPSVEYPASSAYVVAVGGAQYSGTAAAPVGLAVWNDNAGHASGGGTSTQVARPSFQSTGSERQIPDIAAYAAETGIGLIPVCATPTVCVWTQVGGTSAGTAVLSAAALIYSQRHGAVRWGLLAPAIYRAAQQGHLTDITSGTNQTTTDLCCTAAVGYDPASGWGLMAPDTIGPLFT